MAELLSTQWDTGNDFFPPTSFQFVEIQSGIGAANVTPAELTARFNFRYSTVWNHEALQKKTESMLDAHGLNYELDWHLSGKPFLTKPGTLIDATAAAVKQITGIDPELSTGGGTSDGRFISPAGADVVEIGPVNASIHKVNECVKLQDVTALREIYEQILQRLLLAQ
jgi:succinyl-diaminopimelate desuccinylase